MYVFRDNNVSKLENIPEVRYVDKKRIEFTLDFRIQMFNKWKKSPDEKYICKFLEDIGINQEDISTYLYHELHFKFYSGGYPIHRNKREYREDCNYKESNPLLLSQKFHRIEKHWGLEIDPEFRLELKKAYPDISIEEKMLSYGIDPLDVGYNRISKLKKEFEKEARLSYLSSDQTECNVPGNTGIIVDTALCSHPYIKGVDRGELIMTDAFYNESCILEKSLDEIFNLYEIDKTLLSESNRIHINTKLINWKKNNETDFSSDELVLRIQQARLKVLHQKAVSFFRKTGDRFHGLPVYQKRQICLWIDTLSRDPMGYFTKKNILKWMGISKSQYYALLNDENYGTSGEKKKICDEKDIVLIREVIAYKGFEKGIRQVYMLMPKVTGQSFSLYRIRRLMNKYGIRTTIRRPNRNRKVLKELIARNRKANLLMRQFRLYRPNEVRLTDVTYLDYGDGQRAYGSASVDPVTGRLVCFIASAANDLQLALDTLDAMDAYPAKRGAILHSDQGMLYMTDSFQSAVVEKELTQSMSRRGNCWDNAPQESFFGHFKDECHYTECSTLEELRAMISSYAVYYNTERGMWDRERMTPEEYEKHLEAMDEIQWQEHLSREEERCLKRKEASAERAVQEARKYREETEERLEDLKNET